jgi:hypothetical protein
MELPMLDEQEWAEVGPLLANTFQTIKEHRARTGASLAEVLRPEFGRDALQRYFEITGFRETNVNALWHHRLSKFGPPCHACGKPLRTAVARHCAECGAMRA